MILVDTDSILCFESSVRIDIQWVGNVAAICCGGEGVRFPDNRFAFESTTCASHLVCSCSTQQLQVPEKFGFRVWALIKWENCSPQKCRAVVPITQETLVETKALLTECQVRISRASHNRLSGIYRSIMTRDCEYLCRNIDSRELKFFNYSGHGRKFSAYCGGRLATGTGGRNLKCFFWRAATCLPDWGRWLIVSYLSCLPS